jgi:hypothetical protein
MICKRLLEREQCKAFFFFDQWKAGALLRNVWFVNRTVCCLQVFFSFQTEEKKNSKSKFGAEPQFW